MGFPWLPQLAVDRTQTHSAFLLGVQLGPPVSPAGDTEGVSGTNPGQSDGEKLLCPCFSLLWARGTLWPLAVDLNIWADPRVPALGLPLVPAPAPPAQASAQLRVANCQHPNIFPHPFFFLAYAYINKHRHIASVEGS